MGIFTHPIVVFGLIFFSQAAAGDDEDTLSLEAIYALSETNVVSATKSDQKLSHAPAIMTVITRRDIERYGFKSVAEAVNYTAGINVIHDSALPDITLRGITGGIRGGSKLLKVMIDLQPVSFRSETTNFSDRELIPIQAVEQIEIIRGPASPLYGANAFLGVINIVTRPLGEGRFAQVGTEYIHHQGNHGYGFDVLYSDTVHSFSYLLALAGAHIDKSGRKLHCTTYPEKPDPCSQQQDRANEHAFKRQSVGDKDLPLSLVGKFSLKATPTTSIEFMSSYERLDRSAPFTDWAVLNHTVLVDEQGKTVSTLEDSGNRVSLTNWINVLQLDIQPTDRLSMKAGIRYALGRSNRNENLRDAVAENIPVGRYEDNKLAGVKNREGYGYQGTDWFTDIVYQIVKDKPLDLLNNLSVLLSADHSSDIVHLILDNSKFPFEHKAVELHNTGVSLQLTSSFWQEKIGMTAGVRRDSHQGGEVHGKELAAAQANPDSQLCGDRICYERVTHRFGLTYSVYGGDEDHRFGPISHVYVKALHGSAFKAPSPNFLYEQGVLGAWPFAASPTLAAQDVVSTELSLGGVFLDQALDSRLTLFSNQLTNQAEFRRNFQSISAHSTEPIETHGIEWELSYGSRTVSSFINLTGQRSERDTKDKTRNQFVPGFPEYMFKAGLTFEKPEWYSQASLLLRHIGKTIGSHSHRGLNDDRENIYRLSEYTVVDLMLSSHGLSATKRYKPIISFKINNLFDTAFDHPGFNPFHKVDVPGDRRNFIMNLQLRL